MLGVSGCSSEGVCRECPNTGLANGKGSFKAVWGEWRDGCSSCTQCGGRNQDGSEYEVATCTAAADAQCQACAPCPQPPNGSALRVGCTAGYVGDCWSTRWPSRQGLSGWVVLATAAATLQPLPAVAGAGGGWAFSFAPVTLRLTGP